MNDDIKAAIAAATKGVTKSWKQAKRQADRNDRVSTSRIARLRRPPPRITVREVAFDVMEAAYLKASSNGKYFANARQIMYAARPAILAKIDAKDFNDVYFTQTLLKDYLEDFRPTWKVVWDSRGHLIEPHTGKKISLGGVGVANYIGEWSTHITRETPETKVRCATIGPTHRFANALFIEKEGFAEIFAAAGIGARFDMAIMSTKGIPVDAACDLIARMTAAGVRIFALHDFDLAGFKIMRTLKRGTRLSSGSTVIDLGLRMADIAELVSEPVDYKQRQSPAEYLKRCGATTEEIEFLVRGRYGGWSGERVEINAMTSDQLIAWLERKFAEHGVEKVIPDGDTLKESYRRAVFLQRLEKQIEELENEIDDDEAIEIPEQLADQVRKILEADTALSWDDAMWQLASDGSETA